MVAAIFLAIATAIFLGMPGDFEVYTMTFVLFASGVMIAVLDYPKQRGMLIAKIANLQLFVWIIFHEHQPNPFPLF